MRQPVAATSGRRSPGSGEPGVQAFSQASMTSLPGGRGAVGPYVSSGRSIGCWEVTAWDSAAIGQND